jgi:hypothetical protein
MKVSKQTRNAEKLIYPVIGKKINVTVSDGMNSVPAQIKTIDFTTAGESLKIIIEKHDVVVADIEQAIENELINKTLTKDPDDTIPFDCDIGGRLHTILASYEFKNGIFYILKLTDTGKSATPIPELFYLVVLYDEEKLLLTLDEDDNYTRNPLNPAMFESIDSARESSIRTKRNIPRNAEDPMYLDNRTGKQKYFKHKER